MNAAARLTVLCAVVFLPCGAIQAGTTSDHKKAAIASIEKLGGVVVEDDKSAEKPVVRVDVADSRITDGTLCSSKRFHYSQN